MGAIVVVTYVCVTTCYPATSVHLAAQFCLQQSVRLTWAFACTPEGSAECLLDHVHRGVVCLYIEENYIAFYSSNVPQMVLRE